MGKPLANKGFVDATEINMPNVEAMNENIYRVRVGWCVAGCVRRHPECVDFLGVFLCRARTEAASWLRPLCPHPARLQPQPQPGEPPGPFFRVGKVQSSIQSTYKSILQPHFGRCRSKKALYVHNKKCRGGKNV